MNPASPQPRDLHTCDGQGLAARNNNASVSSPGNSRYQMLTAITSRHKVPNRDQHWPTSFRKHAAPETRSMFLEACGACSMFPAYMAPKSSATSAMPGAHVIHLPRSWAGSFDGRRKGWWRRLWQRVDRVGRAAAAACERLSRSLADPALQHVPFSQKIQYAA